MRKKLFLTFITTAIAFLFSKNIGIAMLIGAVDFAVKVLLSYAFKKKNLETQIQITPCVIWLTGLSGAGKTTIAKKLENQLQAQGVQPVLLDGDELRSLMSNQDFSEAARKQHNLNAGLIASFFEKKGKVVIVSLISPYADTRNQVREMCTHFIEVYVNPPLEVCIQRDTKGLYKKAINKEIADFTGISAPYFPPVNAELVLDTATLSLAECTSQIYHLLKK